VHEFRLFPRRLARLGKRGQRRHNRGATHTMRSRASSASRACRSTGRDRLNRRHIVLQRCWGPPGAWSRTVCSAIYHRQCFQQAASLSRRRFAGCRLPRPHRHTVTKSADPFAAVAATPRHTLEPGPGRASFVSADARPASRSLTSRALAPNTTWIGEVRSWCFGDCFDAVYQPRFLHRHSCVRGALSRAHFYG